MITDRCNRYALVTDGCRRRFRRALRLFHDYPSARRYKVEIAEQSQNFRAHVVFEGSIDENQIERVVRSAELAESSSHIGDDHARMIDESELGEIGANRSRGVARGIHERDVRGATRERFDSERAAAGENVEHADTSEIHPHREA